MADNIKKKTMKSISQRVQFMKMSFSTLEITTSYGIRPRMKKTCEIMGLILKQPR